MSAAHDLLNLARNSGYTLTANGDRLKVRPVPPSDLLEAIKTYKAELLTLLSAPANDPDPSPSGGAPTVTQKRPIPAAAPLVTPDDLYRVQRPLLAHLTHCRECIVDLHRYCQAIERESNGYEAFLAEFPDMEQRHQDFVGEVIRARHAVFVRSVH